VHLHRTPEPCDTCHEWPDWARHINAAVNHLAEQQERIMSDHAAPVAAPPATPAA
jgi:hypothetical protein